MRICFKCEKVIKENDKEEPLFMYAIDIPYINLWFHRRCFAEIEDTTEDYILSNYKKLNEFVEKLYE